MKKLILAAVAAVSFMSTAAQATDLTGFVEDIARANRDLQIHHFLNGRAHGRVAGLQEAHRKIITGAGAAYEAATGEALTGGNLVKARKLGTLIDSLDEQLTRERTLANNLSAGLVAEGVRLPVTVYTTGQNGVNDLRAALQVYKQSDNAYAIATAKARGLSTAPTTDAEALAAGRGKAARFGRDGQDVDYHYRAVDALDTLPNEFTVVRHTRGRAVNVSAVDAILNDVTMANIEQTLDQVYDEGFDNGYDEGYADGYRDGFADGVASVN